MATELNESFTIPCDLDTAIRMMSDPGSLDRLMEFSYAENPQHNVQENSDGTLEIHLYREFEGEWPSLIESIVGKRLKIDEKRVWQPVSGNQRIGRTEITSAGLPISVNAEMKIVASDNNCTVSIIGQIKVNVFGIGGMIENLVKEQIQDAIEVERDFYLEELKK